jgi:hypothetical protein
MCLLIIRPDNPAWTSQQKSENYNTVQHRFYGQVGFHFDTIQRICLFSVGFVGFYFDSPLILWTPAVKLCNTIGAWSHVCGVI